MNLRVVPELYCTDIEESKSFYCEVLGFKIKHERKDEQFVYLTLNGVDLMLEGLKGQGRRWLTGKMNRPFGRGVNFQWDVIGIEEIYQNLLTVSPDSIFLELEVKEYECDGKIEIQKQFVVQDPDGYLFRFCSET